MDTLDEWRWFAVTARCCRRDVRERLSFGSLCRECRLSELVPRHQRRTLILSLDSSRRSKSQADDHETRTCECAVVVRTCEWGTVRARGSYLRIDMGSAWWL